MCAVNGTENVEAAFARQGVGKEEIIYTSRFSEQEEAIREETWKVLCAEFLQQFVPESSVVLDLGAGDGKFIRNIKASGKIAVDLSKHVLGLKKDGIEVCQISASEVATHYAGAADVVFMSNFLEHLPDKVVLLNVLDAVYQVLKPGGRLLILQPNIRYVGNAYWDYIDHHIALTEHSLREALEISGFKIERLIPRFLPYTARSMVGRGAGFLGAGQMAALYLRFPFLWRFFGKQTFVVAVPDK